MSETVYSNFVFILILHHNKYFLRKDGPLKKKNLTEKRLSRYVLKNHGFRISQLGTKK